MGAAQSQTQPKRSKSLSQMIDYIATNYILTQNFQDMRKLADLKYCNNLVVLTSKIIANNLNDLEVEYLAQRLKNGIEINEMTKDNVLYFDKENMAKLDVKNSTQKRRLCIGIAKFYVKIAHIFAAVVTTINPVYVYKDSKGLTQQTTLLNKQDIPEDAKTQIERINVCSSRLNALINNRDFNVPAGQPMTVKPKFCGMNFDKKTGRRRKLGTEPGIPELQKLYYNKYDYDAGGFTGMTNKMRKEIYEKDVEAFYKAFTGNDSIPVDEDGNKLINTFSEIPLRDFHRSSGCQDKGAFTRAYTGTLKEKLFAQYAQHVRQMLQTTMTNQDKLLGVIDKLFVFSVNPQTNEKEVVINPKLKEKSLQAIVEETRSLIVGLYLKCEEDFMKGLEIFESIVEKQIIDTSQEQIKELEASIDLTRVAEPHTSDVEEADLARSSEEPEAAAAPKKEDVTTPAPLIETVPLIKPASAEGAEAEEGASPTSAVEVASPLPAPQIEKKLADAAELKPEVILPRAEVVGGGIIRPRSHTAR